MDKMVNVMEMEGTRCKGTRNRGTSWILRYQGRFLKRMDYKSYTEDDKGLAKKQWLRRLKIGNYDICMLLSMESEE